MTPPRRNRTAPAGLQGDEADLYRLLQPRLITRLRGAIRTADDGLHEDAAAHAWTLLLKTQPHRDTALRSEEHTSELQSH